MQGTRAQSHTHLQAHIHKRHTYTSIHTCRHTYTLVHIHIATETDIHIHADRLTYFQAHTCMTCKHIHEGTHRHAHTAHIAHMHIKRIHTGAHLRIIHAGIITTMNACKASAYMQGTHAITYKLPRSTHNTWKAHIHKNTYMQGIYILVHICTMPQTDTQKQVQRSSIRHTHAHTHTRRQAHIFSNTHIHDLQPYTRRHTQARTHKHYIHQIICMCSTYTKSHTVSETINVTICYPLNTSDTAHACKHTHACNAYTCTYTHR